MKETIVLLSTHMGYMSYYFGYTLGIVVLTAYVLWRVFAKEIKNNELNVVTAIAAIIASFAILIIICNFINTAVYSTKTVNTFHQDEKGFVNKLSCESYAFPYSKTNKQIIFDRITHIKVVQNSISRIVNTGTLKVKMVTFTNADSSVEEWSIKGIKNPFERKAELEKKLMPHEGVLIKMYKKE